MNNLYPALSRTSARLIRLIAQCVRLSSVNTRTSGMQIFRGVNQHLLWQLIQYLEIYLNTIILNLYVLHIAVISDVVRICCSKMMVLATKKCWIGFYYYNGLWR